jgi:response regulator RpfG family c-di-GMP phosphodiesterase
VPTWTLWAALGILVWAALNGFALLTFRRLSDAGEADDADDDEFRVARVEPRRAERGASDEPVTILVVDDDSALRTLVRTTFEHAHLRVEEADSAFGASVKIEERRPDVVVLDVAMPVIDGIAFCRSLKADPFTRKIPVVLLTGDVLSDEALQRAGADAHLRKPFSPLSLLSVVERLGERTTLELLPPPAATGDNEQLLLYAEDFRRLLEIERGQRVLLEDAYRDTAVALARALESKDGRTGAHSERVRRYATQLAAAIELSVLDEPTLEYGFILHDVGKIGIPDSILRKRAPLTEAERRLLETHPVLGEQMIGDAALLKGEGARVVRSHHERWDGSGYPDGLRGTEIPLGARIFSVADALDAMTSDRPYRSARRWADAVAEIVGQSGSQFDPQVVEAFQGTEQELRGIYYALTTNFEFSPN